VAVQGQSPDSDIIQTPSSLEVQEAEAEVDGSPVHRRSSGGLLSSLSRKLISGRSFHTSHEDFRNMEERPKAKHVAWNFPAGTFDPATPQQLQ
jgi:hypothetical protein